MSRPLPGAAGAAIQPESLPTNTHRPAPDRRPAHMTTPTRMNIRLMGDGDQVAAVVAALETTPGLHIAKVSRPYAHRRDPEQMRIYLDAEVITGKEQS